MKDIIDKYGMCLRTLKNYIEHSKSPKEKLEIYKELQEFFSINNKSIKFKTDK